MIGFPKPNSSPFVSNKPSSTINITHVVPLVLDLDRMNYDIWWELFEMHCIGYRVVDHLLPPNEKQATPFDSTKRDRLDFIVKSWLFGTLIISILQIIFKTKATAYEVWVNIEKVFRDNKANKII